MSHLYTKLSYYYIIIITNTNIHKYTLKVKDIYKQFSKLEGRAMPTQKLIYLSSQASTLFSVFSVLMCGN